MISVLIPVVDTLAHAANKYNVILVYSVCFVITIIEVNRDLPSFGWTVLLPDIVSPSLRLD